MKTEEGKRAEKKIYDLEARTLIFAKDVRSFIRMIPITIANIEDGKQVIRSSGSVGANYREANEALSKKDFLMRIKIARKEAKETLFWLQIIDCGSSVTAKERCAYLLKEAEEIMMILGSIFRKSS